MGRLIDYDVLLKDIQNTITAQSDTMDWLNMISRQPTAYDVEKVVAELEYQKEKCEEDMEYWQQKPWKDKVAYTNWDLCDRKDDLLEDVIAIVRKGGSE